MRRRFRFYQTLKENRRLARRSQALREAERRQVDQSLPGYVLISALVSSMKIRKHLKEFAHATPGILGQCGFWDEGRAQESHPSPTQGQWRGQGYGRSRRLLRPRRELPLE